MHVHDLDNFFNSPVKHVFSHTVHHLRFGPELPDHIAKRIGGGKTPEWTNHHLNPLDGTFQTADEPAYNFMYFVKVVSTAYLPLGWEKAQESLDEGEGEVVERHVGLGGWGHEHDGSIETHQYSVTSHKRSLNGGDDSAEGHKERLHARGGIPGVFFSYVSQPLPLFLSCSANGD